jgi:translation initiation factor IF-1
MSDDDENGGADVEHIAKITGALAEALSAESVRVKLQSGREISGTVAGFSIRKKESRKGDVSWSGSVKIQTEPGVLQIDCLDIQSIT